MTLIDLLAGADRVWLDGAIFRVLVTEDVRVLVGSASHLGLKWLFREVSFAFVFQACCLLMVWLVVEGIALHCVCCASSAFVVDNILIGVAQHIGAVFTLLKFSCFNHVGSYVFDIGVV